MRALLQKRELEAKAVEPNALARDAVALVRSGARARDVRLEVDLSDDVQPITGDRVHLQQVLLNLLLNAVDAVAGMPEDRRRVIVRTAQSDSETVLAVEDRGTGIPGELLEQVFEPFFTTKGHGMHQMCGNVGVRRCCGTTAAPDTGNQSTDHPSCQPLHGALS